MEAHSEGSLTIVGTGIQLLSHVTLGAKSWIEEAEKVFFSVADPATEAWIKEIRSDATLLPFQVNPGERRWDHYQVIVTILMEAVRKGLRVCAVFYGHPGVFADPCHLAIQQAKAEGYFAQMLPGISADACLFADLGIDPGKVGYQSYEATDFLIRKRNTDPHSVLALWQIAMIGNLSVFDKTQCLQGLGVLTQALMKIYGENHRVFIYEAALYAIHTPLIEEYALSELPEAHVTQRSTLYVPPLGPAKEDPEMMAALGMEI